MSETYTVGGDTWQPLVGFDISGQTFTPIQSHTIYYVDLDLRLFSFAPPQIAISACDASHTPVGAILSYGNHIGPLTYLPGTILRVRFLLETPLNLIEGQIYSIWVYRAISDTGDVNHVLYDKDDATYPRGHIIFSDDGGNTWTHFYNSDLIFCEFGGPPSPPPVTDPPIPNWAPAGLTYIPLLDGVRFCLATSVPCHLTCYWTDVEPRKHRTTRVVRGLDVPWNTYYCFVAWREVEQTEPGDSLYHTFDLTPWPLGETRYFTFRGEVDDIQSPSVGPIFSHFPIAYHHAPIKLFPNAPGDLCKIPYEVGDPCPDHWKNVDEDPPDEDTSYVYQGIPWTRLWRQDLYHIPTTPVSGIITVTIYNRVMRQGGRPTTLVNRTVMKTHGTIYMGPAKINDGTWQYIKQVYTRNPFTGLLWTQAEINDLQIGCATDRKTGVGWGSYGKCTQVYAAIEQSQACPQLI